MKTLRQAKIKIQWKKLLSNWHIILIVLILGVIALLNYRQGYSILTNDNYSPELNPRVSISRILYSPAWRSYRGLGIASDSEQSDLFRVVTYQLLATFVPETDISQIYLILSLVIGSLSFGFLASRIFKDDAYYKFVFIVASILYISTLWTAWVFVFPMMPFLSQFAFLPLLLIGIFDYIQDTTNKNALRLLLFGLLFSTTALISTLFFVNLAVIIVFIFIFSLKNKFKKWIKLLFLVVVPHLIWLIPFISYVSSSGVNVVDSLTNRTITESTIDVEKQKMTGINSARFYSRILDITDATESEEKMFVSADNYNTIEGYKVLSFLPLFFAILGIIFIIRSKKWSYLFIVLGGMVFWFLLKNQNEPLGQGYTWLQNNLKFFRQVFRWPTSKFGQAYLLFLALLSTFGVISIISFFNSFISNKLRKYFGLGSVLFIVLLNLLFVGYLFYGELSADRSYVKIPEEYFELSEFIESSEDTNGRMLVLPLANNSYFREYDWGFIGSGFLWYLIPNPIQEKALSIGSSVNDFADYEIEKSYFSGDLKEFNKDLEKYDIEYILLDQHLVKGRYGYSLDFDLAEEMVENLEKIWSNGKLTLYRNTLLENVDYYQISEDTSHDFLYQGFFSYNNGLPIIYPALEKSQKYDVLTNAIVSSIEFNASDSNYFDNVEDINLGDLPIKIKVSDDELIVRPSLPTVIGHEQIIPESKYRLGTSYKYIIIGDYFINIENLQDWYTLDYKYENIDEVFGVDESYYDSNEYSSDLALLPTYDCAGELDRNSVEISILKNGNFEMTADKGIGCVYKSLSLPGDKQYGVTFSMSWQSKIGTNVGYCIWSEKFDSCVNQSGFIYSNKEDMSIKNDIPVTLSSEDNYSLTLYIYAKDGKQATAEFENIELIFWSEKSLLNKISESSNFKNSTVVMKSGEFVKYEIPIINSKSSFIYNQSEAFIGEPIIETTDGSFSDFWVDEEGSNIRTQGQNASYYHPSLNIEELGKYMMFYWSGNNTRGIPASLCLNYIGDDKCWVEDMIYFNEKEDDVRYFYSGENQKRIFLKFLSMSYANISENSVSAIVLQEVPDGWIKYSLSPSSTEIFRISQASKIRKYSSLYSLNLKDDQDIVTIPESISDNWSAYFIKDNQKLEWMPTQLRELYYVLLGTKIPSEYKITVDGWKQGWNLSKTNNAYYSDVVILYVPNLGSYFGLLCSIVTLVVLSLVSVKDLILKLKRGGKK